MGNVIRPSVAQPRGRHSLTHDLEALAMGLGVLAVLLVLCLVSAISPGAI